jgi:hypothetical protein
MSVRLGLDLTRVFHHRTLGYVAIAAFALASATVLADCSGKSANDGQSTVLLTGCGGVPDGIVFGTTACSGEVYFVLGDGWGFCDTTLLWEYTQLDPSTFGGQYTLETTRAADGGCPADTAGANGSAAAGGCSGKQYLVGSGDPLMCDGGKVLFYCVSGAFSGTTCSSLGPGWTEVSVPVSGATGSGSQSTGSTSGNRSTASSGTARHSSGGS